MAARPRHIGHLPSTLFKEESDENQVETRLEKANDIMPVMLKDSSSCYNLRSDKVSRLSVAGNSLRLRSITLTEVAESTKKKTFVLSRKPKIIEEDAQRFRRKLSPRSTENPFEKYSVPDLALTSIFSNFRKRDLCAAMLVCRKFYAIGNASLNWTSTDVADRPLTEYTVRGLMQKKIKYLRLAGAKQIPDVRVPSRLYNECLFVISRLEILDLSRARLTRRQLMMLLRPCEKLKCLSLEGNVLDNDIVGCLTSNRDLTQLDISMTEGLSVASVSHIFSNCKKIQELNASWCGMNTEMLFGLFENLTPVIKKLNISGSVRNAGLIDEHIEMMVSACPNIVELDLSDNAEIGNGAIALIRDTWSRLETISVNRCYGLDPNVIISLGDVPSLEYVNAIACINEENEKLFIELLQSKKKIKANTQVFNFIAKPCNNSDGPFSVYGHNIREKRY